MKGMSISRRCTLWKCLALVVPAMILVQACASVEAPKGGPEDKAPPRVIAVSPAPRTINSPRDLEIQIQFNEWIVNPVPRSAIRISPPLDGRLESEVDGDLLVIRSKTKLDTLTTYTLNIGSMLKDLHENPVAKPFQLVFSTGPQIDTLQIRGHVLLPDSLIRQKRYPTIGLYPIGLSARESRAYLAKLRDSTTTQPDSTPRLHLESALYIGQSDSTGAFQIDGIAPGRYRVMAFWDQNGNNRIDPSTEIGGLADIDISLDTAFRDTLHWTLANLDTTTPQIISSVVLAPLAVALDFSQPFTIDSLSTHRCGIWNRDSSLFARPKALWIAPDSPRKLVLAFDSVQADSSYLIGCDSVSRMSLRWLPPKDTLVQRLVQFQLLGPNPATDSLPILEIAYNIPVRADTLGPKLRLLVNKDSLPVVATQSDPVRIHVRPVDPLPMGISLKLIHLHTDTTKGKVVAQALGSFETISTIKLSKLQGRVRNGNASTRVRLRAPGKTYAWSTLCSARGDFLLERIPEGPYLMDIFHDLNLDSIPSAGSLFPYSPGETWRPISDTIRVGSDLLPTTLDSILFRYPLPQRTPR